MSAITTHVLDTALGRPAAGVRLRLERADGSQTRILAEATTDDDGRARELGADQVEPGTYRLVFDVAAYAAATGQPCFFPEVAITFALTDATQHHHVPLLLSPFAYSSYRGS
ncbi:hydroxyisourate hydrolase [Nocardioides gansuensis]|uniref:5-hydroxyisourate hydrolase n=1 Tax=Nocardioides gansuensis TaxID=2138300 RepID=A0A2T8FFL4_9ACTN|nr:hydroxyisourate hydrolase [Nocardioides gansuensis]PVG84508.1 hydroxyisourate hydrolase [Nocardioides gansuensis]